MDTDKEQSTNHDLRFTNYAEFWDFYVAEHSEPLTRYLHFIGTLLSSVLLVWIIRGGHWLYLPLCLMRISSRKRAERKQLLVFPNNVSAKRQLNGLCWLFGYWFSQLSS